MSVTARDIYNSALAIMHEKPAEDYEERALAIINTLIGQSWAFSADHDFGPHNLWTPAADMNSELEGVDISIALSGMPYGLAAMLYLDEDPVRSGSWWDIWQEALATFRRCRPASFETIKDVYGGIGRWGE